MLKIKCKYIASHRIAYVDKKGVAKLRVGGVMKTSVKLKSNIEKIQTKDRVFRQNCDFLPKEYMYNIQNFLVVCIRYI